RLDSFDPQQTVVDAWVVDLADEERWSEEIDQLLEVAEAPVLFGLGSAPARGSIDYPRWERRLFTKLRDLAGNPAHLSEQGDALGQLADVSQRQRVQLPESIAPF